MKTGTDISLTECRASGYPVVEHGKKPLDVSKRYHLTISNPRAWTDSGTVKFGAREIYDTDIFISYNELWESFQRGGEGIKSYCDFENCPYPTPSENPSFMCFASLAGTVRSYHGLE